MPKGTRKQTPGPKKKMLNDQQIITLESLGIKTPETPEYTGHKESLATPINMNLFDDEGDEAYVEKNTFNIFKNSVEQDVQNFKVKIEEIKNSLVLNDETKNKSVEALKEEIEKIKKSLALNDETNNESVEGLKKELEEFKNSLVLNNETKNKSVEALKVKIEEIKNSLNNPDIDGLKKNLGIDVLTQSLNNYVQLADSNSKLRNAPKK